ncbi:MAG: hypothetical protein OZSIB_2254 [Candidatus Ozemobacter sibiricus]|uniref:DZANK-type domain-containing protein n=1 Tax=Candidatus Ozemobacter sibiricus TaxID=2268124 RepID=A0A367ZTB8_9BACT|nr:MAG: hypothetical protein OZSIB_2254 [Candidatus Ozemobacter sibiricus]
MPRLHSTVTLLLAFLFLLIPAVQAFQNVCPTCRTLADPEDVVCRKCLWQLNQCLVCGTTNPVSANFCAQCDNALAPSRVLATIDPEVRAKLKLGASPRALLERDLSRLQHLLEVGKGNPEEILFQIGLTLKKMEFAAREAAIWADFLARFPASPKAEEAARLRADALFRWGALFYQQGDLEAAEERFRQATEAEPRNDTAWTWLGRVRLKLADGPGARAALQQALTINPANRSARHLMGVKPAAHRPPPPAAPEPEPAPAPAPVPTAPESAPAPAPVPAPASPPPASPPPAQP